MSSPEQVIDSWNELKSKVRQYWEQLSDEDLLMVDGKIDQLIAVIQQKTGQGRQQIESILSKFSKDPAGAFTNATEAACEYVGQAADALRNATDELRARGRESYEEAERVVCRRPAECVAIAFGTGLMIGLLIGLVGNSRKS